jgi:signal transduction histidine kinase
VMRHAPHSHVHVQLRVVENALQIEVDDDGTAAVSGSPSAGGHGLRGMRERAAALGGEVTAGPAPSRGWHVRARLPLAPAGRR